MGLRRWDSKERFSFRAFKTSKTRLATESYLFWAKTNSTRFVYRSGRMLLSMEIRQRGRERKRKREKKQMLITPELSLSLLCEKSMWINLSVEGSKEGRFSLCLSFFRQTVGTADSQRANQYRRITSSAHFDVEWTSKGRTRCCW